MTRAYRGPLQLVVFDWAGTTVDHGCFAPVVPFQELFRARGVDLTVAEQSIQRKAVVYDGDGDAHYDTISAFIKSMRGSDVDVSRTGGGTGRGKGGGSPSTSATRRQISSPSRNGDTVASHCLACSLSQCASSAAGLLNSIRTMNAPRRPSHCKTSKRGRPRSLRVD